MLDNDLAEVYGVETKVLNQAVKRNASRFPEDFSFRLSKEEYGQIRGSSQFVTSSRRFRGTTYLPTAFTEHGAVMLASILNSPTAVEASIVVVRAFVKIRSILALLQDLADRVEELEKMADYHDQKFGVVSRLLSEIMRDSKYLKKPIGFVSEKKTKARK